MKKTDLSRVEIQSLNGQIVDYNLAKELAEVIFQNTQSIAEHTFCMELYKNPVIELTEENKTIIEKYIQQYFKAFVQVAVKELFQEDEKEDKGMVQIKTIDEEFTERPVKEIIEL